MVLEQASTYHVRSTAPHHLIRKEDIVEYKIVFSSCLHICRWVNSKPEVKSFKKRKVGADNFNSGRTVAFVQVVWWDDWLWRMLVFFIFFIFMHSIFLTLQSLSSKKVNPIYLTVLLLTSIMMIGVPSRKDRTVTVVDWLIFSSCRYGSHLVSQRRWDLYTEERQGGSSRHQRHPETADPGNMCSTCTLLTL